MASVSPAAHLYALMNGQSNVRCRRTNNYGSRIVRAFWNVANANASNIRMTMLHELLSNSAHGVNVDKLMETVVDIVDHPENIIDHYKRFYIKKKSGGQRLIEAPDENLKTIQRILLDKWWYPKRGPEPFMHGFIPGRGVLTNALAHFADGKPGKDKILLKIDFSDLFPSITKVSIMNALLSDLGGWLFGSVRPRRFPSTFFPLLRALRNKKFDFVPSQSYITSMENRCLPDISPYREPVALCFFELALDSIALELCCLDERLPQGSPCSPYLANLFLKPLHQRIINHIKKEVGSDFTYTVYADDICLTAPKDWLKSNKIEQARKIIYSMTYQYPDLCINRKKTGVFRQGMSQKVTGVTITDKISISRQDRDKVRAELHLAATGKKILTNEDKMRLRGMRAWMRGVDRAGWDSRCEKEFMEVIGQ